MVLALRILLNPTLLILSDELLRDNRVRPHQCVRQRVKQRHLRRRGATIAICHGLHLKAAEVAFKFRLASGRREAPPTRRRKSVRSESMPDKKEQRTHIRIESRGLRKRTTTRFAPRRTCGQKMRATRRKRRQHRRLVQSQSSRQTRNSSLRLRAGARPTPRQNPFQPLSSGPLNE